MEYIYNIAMKALKGMIKFSGGPFCDRKCVGEEWEQEGKIKELQLYGWLF